MIYGISDLNIDESNMESYEPETDPLDKHINSLKHEIKILEKDFITKNAEKQLNDEVIKERRRKEATELERQINNLTKANEHEQTKVTFYQNEITKRETNQPVLPPPDTTDETINLIRQQNESLSEEIKKIHQELQSEVGEDYDIDQIIKTGGSSKQRAQELQRLQAQYAKSQCTYVDAKRTDEINEAGKKIQRNLELLIQQKDQLQLEIQEMRSQIAKTQNKVDSMEEENRALRMIDVLLNEKLGHDFILIEHLRESLKDDEEELPEMEIPPLTDTFIQQLYAQQNIVRGLIWKLCLSQKDVARNQVPPSFSFLADQLGQLNKKCIQLQNAFLEREMTATLKIQEKLDEISV